MTWALHDHQHVGVYAAVAGAGLRAVRQGVDPHLIRPRCCCRSPTHPCTAWCRGPTPQYNLFLEDGRRFLLAARKRKKQTTSNYLVSLNYDDLDRESDNFFGKVCHLGGWTSSVVCLHFRVCTATCWWGLAHVAGTAVQRESHPDTTTTHRGWPPGARKLCGHRVHAV